MKVINNITVFDNDKYFLSMLKGYCYANNITITAADFDIDGIKEIEKLNPDLIIVPLDWVCTTSKSIETHLLWRIGASSEVKICGLNKNTTDINSVGAGRVDIIINNSLDISEIDGHLKKTFLFGRLNEKRIHKERRYIADRRSTESNRTHDNGDDGYKEHRNPGHLHQATSPEFSDLQINLRKRCVFLRGHKVDLTPKEFELLELLSTDVDRIFMANEIINHLWPESNRATKSDLYQYTHSLRKKIEIDLNNPQWIITVKGFGYRLNIDNSHEVHQDSFRFLEKTTLM